MAASGILLGLAAFMLKVGMSGIILDSWFIVSALHSEALWIAAIFGIIGFLLMQRALHLEKVSIVTPTIGGVSIIIPVLLAYTFLGEAMSTMKWVGVVLVLIGVAGLGK
jgi:drug/metabolite transporter (DMT)-like permease